MHISDKEVLVSETTVASSSIVVPILRQVAKWIDEAKVEGQAENFGAGYNEIAYILVSPNGDFGNLQLLTAINPPRNGRLRKVEKELFKGG